MSNNEKTSKHDKSYSDKPSSMRDRCFCPCGSFILSPCCEEHMEWGRCMDCVPLTDAERAEINRKKAIEGISLARVEHMEALERRAGGDPEQIWVHWPDYGDERDEMSWEEQEAWEIARYGERVYDNMPEPKGHKVDWEYKCEGLRK